MPQTLSENPEELVRQLLTDEWIPSNTEGYDPTTTDTTASDFLPISTDWNTGDIYPIITVTNNDPTVPGGGETNVTGKQGDGSGNNQRRLETMQLTVQASGDTDYLNDVTAHQICETLYNEAFRVLWDNQSAPNDDDIWNYFVTPATHTVEKSDTSSFHQYVGSVTIHWQREP